MEVKQVRVKSILNKHRKRDDWFLDDYSLNPYISCGFNCVYCYVKGSVYGRYAGGELRVKVNAPFLLEKELRFRARRREYGFIALSSSTEPWQKVEDKLKVTRRCLEVISSFSFPVHCLTKSTLILRDLDLLSEINRRAKLPPDLKGKVKGGVLVTISLSTLNGEVASLLEPGAPKPLERLETLWRVREEGFQAGLAFIPVLPFISDLKEQLEEMVKTAREYDACYVFVGSLTLHSKKRFYRFLRVYYPELVARYEQLYKNSSYPPRWYNRKLQGVAERLCRRYGLKTRIA